MKAKICFIINPISGVGAQKLIEPLLAEVFPVKDFSCIIKYTESPKHATVLAQMAVEEGFETIVAVGGDGSVNEVSAGMLNSKAKMGIVPCGSGNGFARHLNISMDLRDALLTIKKGKSIQVDTLAINKKSLVNIAGLGFDAHVAHCFAKSSKRGFFTYLKIILNEFLSYKETTYTIETDAQKVNIKAYLLSIANASQYGNNAAISPQSEASDGKFEICALQKPPLYLIPWLALLLFTKKLDRSAYFKSIVCTKASIVSQHAQAHIDGEAVDLLSPIELSVLPLSLQVIVP